MGRVPRGLEEVINACRGITWSGRPKVFSGVPVERGSNPQPSVATRDPFEVERRGNCPRYRGCLDLADRMRWQGFHCGHCSVRETISEEQERSDRESCARLWARVKTIRE